MSYTNGNGNENNDGSEGHLSTRAFLVSLTISMWTARKMDRTVTNKTNSEAGFSGSEVGRYNKNLLIENEQGKMAKEFKAVEAAGAAARINHYDQTSPWLDDGSRVLTAANFLEWANAIREARNAYEQALKLFLDAYPQLIEQSKYYFDSAADTENRRLFLAGKPETARSMFDRKNYPSVDQIERKFGFRSSYRPLPEAGDFRAALSESQVKSIRAQIETDQHAMLDNITQDLFQRLGQVVKRVVHIGDPDSKLIKSLSGDIRSVCAVAGRLNLSGNSYVEEYRKQIERDLAVEVDVLKALPEERKRIAAKARQIQEDMARFMGPIE